ncbi:MAG: hypothetical protein GXP54_06420 [Deltaproteobacteria bacterium]|nr:hypothetical protein [Deltaproteobacteria bacterium]
MNDFEPDAVEDGLWVGRAPRTPEDFAFLSDIGVTDVLTLQTEDEARLCGIRPSIGFRLAGAHGMALHRIPMRDFSRRELTDRLAEAAVLVKKLRDKRRHVYVHCAIGINRSPTVVAAYLALSRGLDAGEACRVVKTAHLSHPDQEAVREALKGLDR